MEPLKPTTPETPSDTASQPRIISSKHYAPEQVDELWLEHMKMEDQNSNEPKMDQQASKAEGPKVSPSMQRFIDICAAHGVEVTPDYSRAGQGFCRPSSLPKREASDNTNAKEGHQ